MLNTLKGCLDKTAPRAGRRPSSEISLCDETLYDGTAIPRPPRAPAPYKDKKDSFFYCFESQRGATELSRRRELGESREVLSKTRGACTTLYTRYRRYLRRYVHYVVGVK